MSRKTRIALGVLGFLVVSVGVIVFRHVGSDDQANDGEVTIRSNATDSDDGGGRSASGEELLDRRLPPQGVGLARSSEEPLPERRRLPLPARSTASDRPPFDDSEFPAQDEPSLEAEFTSRRDQLRGEPPRGPKLLPVGRSSAKDSEPASSTTVRSPFEDDSSNASAGPMVDEEEPTTGRASVRPREHAEGDEPGRLETGDFSAANRRSARPPLFPPKPLGEKPVLRKELAFDDTAEDGMPAAGLTEPQPTSRSSQQIYVIQPNDSFWSISKAAYGTPRYFQALAEFNRDRIGDTRRMRPGTQIVIPPAEQLDARYPKLVPPGSNRPTVRTAADEQPATAAAAPSSGFFRDSAGRPSYRVGPNERLEEIAQTHLGRRARWIQILHLNRDDLHNRTTPPEGTILRLPVDAREKPLASPPSAGR